MAIKTYLVAVRGDKLSDVSPQWVEQLRQIPGVKVHEASADQARITSDETGIKAVRSALISHWLVEEEKPRGPAD